MSVTSNTGPLVALAKADLLHVLKDLFGETHIPPGVHRELLAKAGTEAVRLDAALADHVKVTQVGPLPQRVEQAIRDLGTGEAQAIALAMSVGSTLVIDERQGRLIARQLGVVVTGTVGVLIEAKSAGLIAEVRPLLEKTRDNGYYFTQALIDAAARVCGEWNEHGDGQA